MPQKLQAVVIDDADSDYDEESFFNVDLPEDVASESESEKSEGGGEDINATKIEARKHRETAQEPPATPEKAMDDKSSSQLDSPSQRTRSQIGDDYTSTSKRPRSLEFSEDNVSAKRSPHKGPKSLSSLDPEILARINAIKARRNKSFEVHVGLENKLFHPIYMDRSILFERLNGTKSIMVNCKKTVGDVKNVYMEDLMNLEGIDNEQLLEGLRQQIRVAFTRSVALHKHSIIQDNVELSLLADEKEPFVRFVFMYRPQAEEAEETWNLEKQRLREAMEQRAREALKAQEELDELVDAEPADKPSEAAVESHEDKSKQDEGKFLVKMRGKDNKVVEVMIRPQTKVSDMIAYYRTKRELEPNVKINLEFDSEPMSADQTADDYELEDDYVIDVIIL